MGPNKIRLSTNPSTAQTGPARLETHPYPDSPFPFKTAKIAYLLLFSFFFTFLSVCVLVLLIFTPLKPRSCHAENGSSSSGNVENACNMVTLESSKRSLRRSQRARALLVYNGGYSDRTIALCELWEAFPSVSQGYRKSLFLERSCCNFFPLVSAIACNEIQDGTQRFTRRTSHSPVLIHLSINCSDGIRTSGVFTKCDLMDKGTNAVEIPGIIYVKDRTVDELEDELDHLDDAAVRMHTILELCHNFEQNYKEHLDGRRPGGAQIYRILEYQLPNALKKLPFDHHLSLQNVKKVVFEADGYLPHLIAPEQAYRRLIENGVTNFRGPAEASVDRVHSVLKEIVRRSIAETQDLKRFPALQAEIIEAALEALQRYREESKRTTLQLVEMESSYITLDFFRKLSQEIENGGISVATAGDEYSDVHYCRIRLHVSSYLKMVSRTLRHAIPKAIVHCQVREARTSLLDGFYAQICRTKGDELARLLDEDPAFRGQRQECSRKLEFY